jgi:hypothetical protein
MKQAVAPRAMPVPNTNAIAGCCLLLVMALAGWLLVFQLYVLAIAACAPTHPPSQPLPAVALTNTSCVARGDNNNNSRKQDVTTIRRKRFYFSFCAM